MIRPRIPIRTASWGAGLQSTAMIAMSVLGELPPLDHVLHCDLGWERLTTYAARYWYSDWFEDNGLTVHILPTGNIRDQAALPHIHMPFWTETGGHLRRQCTRHFRIRPTRRHLRTLIDHHPTLPPNPPTGSVEQWIGISTDEWKRARSSEVEYIVNRHPLLQLHMSRADCAAWLEGHGLPVPAKSACIGCPFRKASEWIEMRDEAPAEFADACRFDETIRHHTLDRVTDANLYIYQHGLPLAAADLEADAAREIRPPNPDHVQLLLPDCEAPYVLA